MLNCGSSGISTDPDGREWTGDVGIHSKFVSLEQSNNTFILSNSHGTSIDRDPYKTARIFHSQFTYRFRVSPGQKFIRFYFNPSTYHDNFDMSYKNYESGTKSVIFIEATVGVISVIFLLGLTIIWRRMRTKSIKKWNTANSTSCRPSLYSSRNQDCHKQLWPGPYHWKRRLWLCIERLHRWTSQNYCIWVNGSWSTSWSSLQNR